MKWSLLVGRFWGTEIRLHASLLLLIPYVMFTFQPQGLAGLARLLLLVIAIFACVALHEMGHTLAARSFGIAVKSIVLWPMGGFANLSRRPERVWQDIILSAAGPLTNLLIACLLSILAVAERLINIYLSFPRQLLAEWQVFPILIGLIIANLGLALFNLVPVYPMDGGQIARNLLKLAFGERNADRLMLIFSLPLALGLTLYGLFTGDLAVGLTGLLLMLGSATLSTRLLNGAVLGVMYFMDRAGYHLRRQDLDAALKEYTRAIDRAPNRPGLYVNRAVTYMNLMDLSHAKADVQRALGLDASIVIAWALRGELLALEKQYEPALEAFNHAITLNPNWVLAYLDRGGIYQELGDLQRAQQDMDYAIALGGNVSVAYYLRSILRYKLGDLPGSRADAEKALRFAPQWMLVFPELFLENLQGSLDWAMEYYRLAIEKLPNAYQAYQGRADALRINQQPAQAVADYDRAIQLAPRQAELYLGRGQAYLQLERRSEAVQDFRTAASLADRRHLRRKAEDLLRSTP